MTNMTSKKAAQQFDVRGLLRGKLLLVAILAAFIGTAGAEPLVGESARPYIGMLGGIAKPLRGTDTTGTQLQPSGQFIIGLPLDAAVSLESSAFYSEGGGRPKGYGAGYDLALRDPDGRPGVLLLAGFGGFKRSDGKHLLPYASVGTGLILPINNALRLRTDARLFAIRETTLTTGRDLLLEARLGFGLELTQPSSASDQQQSSEQAPNLQPPVDSDDDGIADASDRCPSSASDERVDGDGCSISPATAVAPLKHDVAPAPSVARLCQEFNIPSLMTSQTGCLVPQAAPVPEIQFEPDATKLAAEGALAVDRLAIALQSQPQLSVKIVSYATDGAAKSGIANFDELRAELIKSRLIGRGVSASRLRTEVINANAAEAGSSVPASTSIGLLLEAIP